MILYPITYLIVNEKLKVILLLILLYVQPRDEINDNIYYPIFFIIYLTYVNNNLKCRI